MKASISVAEILRLSQGRVANGDSLKSDPSDRSVNAVHVLKGSGSEHLSFFFSREYESEVPHARPGVLITAEPFVGPLSQSGLPLWSGSVVIACKDPYLAMAKLSAAFERFHDPLPGGGVHPKAHVDASARVHASASVAPGAVVESGAELGANSVVGPGTVVGRDCIVGEGTLLFANVTLYPGVKLGRACRIHSGVVIGGDGFGYAPEVDAKGMVINHRKIVHHGSVVIGDEVEIGAGTCIDRGTMGDTVIGSKTKIDNLVQIGHNCQVGEGVILCGKVGLAGGAIVGDFATIGGATGIGNRVRVGHRAQVGGMSRITKDVKDGTAAVGYPQLEPAEQLRYQATLNKIVKERRKK